ncbi:MAG: biotin/lipoyl-binding protein [Clostridiales bacterium]|uniref:biotin/lipoyl-containing protein n=1 Tax=Clostridium sp. N3C TaxID=1776758 RepID=UPI00092DECAF|nr:biotin/lipoyl-containing protein [Clostridium sp. N3C]NLZ47613.1 biotin/lipoyl-binding protein [Clostridiales bacterium]SCN22759.1 2-oxoglutarate carboxylase large subunit [Clostridium sp. N3C]
MKYVVTLNNKRYEVEVERGKASILSTSEIDSKATQVVAETPKNQAPVQESGAKDVLKAPMPGTVLEIKVNQGARVKEGDVVIILEAMKMENEITASSSGLVKKILVTKGQMVDTNDALVVIE